LEVINSKSFNKLENYLQVGLVKIFLPDHNSKEFFIFEDLATLLDIESNFEAEFFLKKKIKESGIKGKITLDSESDYVSLRTKNASLILSVALLINNLKKYSIEEEVITEYNKFLTSWKTPKKQKWGIGDIFSIPLSDGTYYFGQIVELVEGLTPICILFDVNKNTLPEYTELAKAEILTALSFIPDKLNDYSFKVINNLPLFAKIKENIRRDPVRNIQHSSITLVYYCEDIKFNKGSYKFESITSNREFVIPLD